MQVVEDGYEFFAKRQLVTLFSAPNYCGEFDNAGAMMSVDETLMCSFQILKPTERKQKFPIGVSPLPRAHGAVSEASSTACRWCPHPAPIHTSEDCEEEEVRTLKFRHTLLLRSDYCI